MGILERFLRNDLGRLNASGMTSAERDRHNAAIDSFQALQLVKNEAVNSVILMGDPAETLLVSLVKLRLALQRFEEVDSLRPHFCPTCGLARGLSGPARAAKTGPEAALPAEGPGECVQCGAKALSLYPGRLCGMCGL